MCRDEEATVFVGDLPPGCGHYELQELFSQLATVVNIKHLEHKNIAFVTVESDAEVGHIIDVADTSGLHMHGTMIRVARAHQPSDGQVLPQPPSSAQSMSSTGIAPHARLTGT